MPIFSGRFRPTNVPDPPLYPDLLRQMGPIVEVTLEVPEALAKTLEKDGKPIPPPIKGPALIDTGASMTSVARRVPGQLGVSPIGNATLLGAGGAAPAILFPIRVTIPALNSIWHFENVMDADLEPLGYVALIGRDLLQRGLLDYNGRIGEYTLALDP